MVDWLGKKVDVQKLKVNRKIKHKYLTLYVRYHEDAKLWYIDRKTKEGAFIHLLSFKASINSTDTTLITMYEKTRLKNRIEELRLERIQKAKEKKERESVQAG
jgi:hypothetical protein